MGNAEIYGWSLEQSGTLPSSRKAASMAYDSKRASILLFGGGGLDDTWMWHGGAWREVFSTLTPPARTSATMVYDAAHEQILLFGGANSQGQPLNDTWLWNGTTWREVYSSNAPDARSGAAMAYDQARQQVLLFGGQTYGGRAGSLLSDTWAWDGTQWHEIYAPTAPYARIGATMAYHAATGKIVLFGGTTGHTTFRDTWLWNGRTWHEAGAAEGPPARAWATTTYHPDIRQVILVGGSGHNGITGSPLALGDTWTWNGATWQYSPSQSAPSGSYNSATYDESRHAIVVYATRGGKLQQGYKDSDQLQDTYAALDSEIWLWQV